MKDVLTRTDAAKFTHIRAVDPNNHRVVLNRDLARTNSGCLGIDPDGVCIQVSDHRNEDNPVFVRLESGGSQRDYLLCEPYPGGGPTRYYAIDTCFPAFPSPRWVNMNRNAVYVSKKNGRFWRVGIFPSQVQVDIPYGGLLRNMLGITIGKALRFNDRSHPQILKKLMTNGRMFDPVYPSLRVAMKKIEDGEALSVALSEDCCVATHPISGVPWLWWGAEPVASLFKMKPRILSQYAWLEDSIMEVCNA